MHYCFHLDEECSDSERYGLDDVESLYDFALACGHRCYDVEHVIIQSAKYACYYAMHVMKQRWIDAEKVIMEYELEDFAQDYIKCFNLPLEHC